MSAARELVLILKYFKKSTNYGEWEPIHNIIFSIELQKDFQYRIIFKISENEIAASKVNQES